MDSALDATNNCSTHSKGLVGLILREQTRFWRRIFRRVAKALLGASCQVNRNRYRALDRGYALKARCHEKAVKGPSHWEEIMIHSKRVGRSPSHDYVAGNGLINRRALLGQGIAIAGAVGAAGSINGAAADPLVDEPWSLEFGSVIPPVQTPSPFEKNVVRSLSNPNGEFRNSHARTPHQLLGGTVTPNGLHFTICHCGVPNIDPAKHKLVIHGMVRQPLEFTLETLSRYPLVTRTAFVECAGNSAPMFSKVPLQTTAGMLHGLVSNSEWTGVPLSTLLDEAGIDPNAKWLIAEGADAQLRSLLDRQVGGLAAHTHKPLRPYSIFVLESVGEHEDRFDVAAGTSARSPVRYPLCIGLSLFCNRQQHDESGCDLANGADQAESCNGCMQEDQRAEHRAERKSQIPKGGIERQRDGCGLESTARIR